MFVWNVDDNCFTRSTTVDLLRSGNVEITEGLELRRGSLETEDFFGYRELEIISGCLLFGVNEFV
jgi:hypothetical protein